MTDLEFLAGDFLLDGDFEIPVELAWIQKYFKTRIQLQWLRFFLIQGDSTMFTQHTGCFVRTHYLKRLERKYKKLISHHNQIKADFEIEKLWLLKTGRLKMTRLS